MYGTILARTIHDPNEITIMGDIAEIVLYNNKNQEVARAIIDRKAIKKVKKHKWHLSVDGYVRTRIKNNIVGLQHVLLGTSPNLEVIIDHKDKNPLNNLLSNLRLCSQKENSRNSSLGKNNTSGYRGVHWDKRIKKWIAQIGVNRTRFNLGRFKTKLEAARKYNEAAIKYHGEFACLNKIT